MSALVRLVALLIGLPFLIVGAVAMISGMGMLWLAFVISECSIGVGDQAYRDFMRKTVVGL